MADLKTKCFENERKKLKSYPMNPYLKIETSLIH